MRIEVRVPPEETSVPPEIRELVLSVSKIEFPYSEEPWSVTFERAQVDDPDEESPFDQVILVVSRKCSVRIKLAEYIGNGRTAEFRQAVITKFVIYWKEEQVKLNQEAEIFKERIHYFQAPISA